MNTPIVPVVHVPDRRRHASLGHHSVGLAQQRLAHHADRGALRRCGDGGAEPGPAGADDQHVMFMDLMFRHQKILQSVQIPIEHKRT